MRHARVPAVETVKVGIAELNGFDVTQSVSKIARGMIVPTLPARFDHIDLKETA
jgi:hypothetical protein